MSSCVVSVQMRKMSSMYRVRTRGLMFCVRRKPLIMVEKNISDSGRECGSHCRFFDLLEE